MNKKDKKETRAEALERLLVPALNNHSSAKKGKAMKIYMALASVLFAASAWATQVATPTLSLTAGTYQGPQTVTISCATAGETITCTTDGSVLTSPTAFTYSTAIPITINTTLKCVATLSGSTNSTVVQAVYIIQRDKAGLLADLAARVWANKLVGDKTTSIGIPRLLGTEGPTGAVINHYQITIIEVSPSGLSAIVRNVYFFVLNEGLAGELAYYDIQTPPQAQIPATQ